MDIYVRIDFSYFRDLTKKYSDVRVISGPVWIARDLKPSDLEYLQKKDEKMRRQRKKLPKMMKYEVIGKNEVAVPTHLFKIILTEDPKLENPLLAAFIVPNKPIKSDMALSQFQTSLAEVERITGFKYHQVPGGSVVLRLAA